MRKIKWGILGTADIAKGCTIPGMQMAGDCELYAIAGRDEKKVKRFQEEYGFEKAYIGYEALLNDGEVEALYIPLPNSLHYEWVMQAIEAGKHVLCEKPLALSKKEAEEMFAAAQKKGVILAEAYAYLHSPYVKSLREDIRSGMIGEIDYIETAFVTQGYKEDIRLSKELGGGALYDLGCYCTTMILSLVGETPIHVNAMAEMSAEGVDLMTSVIMKFDNGIRASFDVGMILGEDSNARMDRLYIHGSNGCIKSAVEYNQEGKIRYTVVSDGKDIVRELYAKQNYCLEFEQMNRCIRDGEKAEITPEFSISNAGVIDTILKKIGG